MEYRHGGDLYTYPGLLDFSSNSNPFGPCPGVEKAIKEAFGDIGHYPDPKCRALAKALAARLPIPQTFLVFGNGAADLIFSLALAEKPVRALLTAPAFSEYARALEAVGCDISYYDLKEEENFILREDYLEILDGDWDMIFLCSPDNPTGNVIDPTLLTRIADRCAERKIRMVLDECFCEFTREPDALSLVWDHPQVFLLRAFTKMYAMPGLRLGYGICSDEAFLERLACVRQPWSVSVVAQAAGIAALKEDLWVEQCRRAIEKERSFLEEKLKKLGIFYIPSQGNYILIRSEYALWELLREEGILIRDCSDYRGLSKGYYRFAVRTPEENLRLVAALEKIYDTKKGD